MLKYAFVCGGVYIMGVKVHGYLILHCYNWTSMTTFLIPFFRSERRAMIKKKRTARIKTWFAISATNKVVLHFQVWRYCTFSCVTSGTWILWAWPQGASTILRPCAICWSIHNCIIDPLVEKSYSLHLSLFLCCFNLYPRCQLDIQSASSTYFIFHIFFPFKWYSDLSLIYVLALHVYQ
jgi:hypothetical protein